MPFVWDDKYRLGIPEIDRQHQTLLLLLNKAFDFYSHDAGGMAQEALRQRVLKDLAGLREFVRAHFATEETFMDRYDYPDMNRHCREHAKLLEITAQWEEKTTGAKDFSPHEWIEIILAWYDYHVRHIDRELGEFLRNNGEFKAAKAIS